MYESRFSLSRSAHANRTAGASRACVTRDSAVMKRRVLHRASSVILFWRRARPARAHSSSLIFNRVVLCVRRRRAAWRQRHRSLAAAAVHLGGGDALHRLRRSPAALRHEAPRWQRCRQRGVTARREQAQVRQRVCSGGGGAADAERVAAAGGCHGKDNIRLRCNAAGEGAGPRQAVRATRRDHAPTGDAPARQPRRAPRPSRRSRAGEATAAARGARWRT